MSAVPAPESGPDAGAVWHYGDPLGEQRAAEHDAVVVDRSHSFVIAVTGTERLSWLHSLSTQHVAVQPDGTWYYNVTPANMDRIITEHLVGGQPVQELVFHQGPNIG